MTAYRQDTRVAAQYELTLDDYARAIRSERRRGNWALLAALVFGEVAVVGATMALRLGLEPAAIGTGVLTALVGWLLLKSRRIGMAELEKRFDDVREQRLEVSEEAFELHDRVSGKRIAWELVLHWRETPEAFLVFVTRRRFHVIPKRLLPSKETETTLRQLLEDRVAPGGEARLAGRDPKELLGPLFALGVVLALIGTLLEACLAFLY